MEFKYRAVDSQASTYVPQSLNYNYFTGQAVRGSYDRSNLQFSEIIRNRTGYLSSSYGRGDYYFGNSDDVRAGIQRELEKERIREEIIEAEIARRRMLEAEVRREMLMEREMALRRGESFPSSSSMRFDQGLSILHKPEGRSFEERIAFSIEERFGYLAPRRDVGGLEILPFQRNVEPRIKEIEPVPEVSKQKERVVLLAKPEANSSGGKRKALTPTEIGTIELPSSIGPMKKKAKEEWACAICQVTATSERALNEHIQGKKHKSKEAGSRADGKGKYAIGLFPKESVKPIKILEINANPSFGQGSTIEGEVLKTQNTKHGLDRDKKFKFWCEMCQVGAFSIKVMNKHKKGKKHVARLQKLTDTKEASRDREGNV